jgi:hypothetical protein
MPLQTKMVAQALRAVYDSIARGVSIAVSAERMA